MIQKNNLTQQITSSFLKLLQLEGDKAWNICALLNENSNYEKEVTLITDSKKQGAIYKTQHLLLTDIVNLFISSYSTTSEIPLKAKFILIYLYEKLQGKDLATSLNLQQINKLTISNQFDKNVNLILKTPFFDPVGALKNEFITTYLVTQIKKDKLNSITSFLNRILLLLTQTKSNKSNSEIAKIKEVKKKINQPLPRIRTSNITGIPEDDTLEIVLSELNELIGLKQVKEQIEKLTDFLKIQKIREEKGLKTNHNSLHTVFMGPPGTGKTTIARLLGRIFKHLGYLKSGHLIETDRAGMVAGYVGQTAIKADEIIASAKDGVLFIDEAYSLTNGGMNDFGKEAIEVLLKRMEDMRKNLVIIVAGYPHEMEIFLQSNPGLQSRFNRYFTFNHYEEKTLLEIFKLNAEKSDFKLTKDAEEKLSDIINGLYKKRHRGFGNARTMRNLFEKIIELQASRIIQIENLSEDILISITEEDIPEVKKTVNEIISFNES